MTTPDPELHVTEATYWVHVGNAREVLRRVVRYYEERLGRRPPTRPRVESIDYLDGGNRRVG